EGQLFVVAQGIERLRQLARVFPEVTEAEFLDLRNREADAVLLVDLEVRPDDRIRRTGEDHRTRAEDLVGKRLRVHAGDPGEPGEDRAVLLGRSGTVEMERVGDDAAHHDPGDLRRGRDA